jgi:hypothetical protein
MGTPKEPEKAILFAGLLFVNEVHLLRAVDLLKKNYGDAVDESDIFDWSHSKYYKDELGPDVKRKFMLFDKIISPEEIVDIKLTTNEIEHELSKNGKRTVNIDPGYITLGKLVLATTKNYSHRIYLDKGIYAEVTLYYRDEDFHPTPFTFNDYRQREYRDFFKSSREYLKNRPNP